MPPRSGALRIAAAAAAFIAAVELARAEAEEGGGGADDGEGGSGEGAGGEEEDPVPAAHACAACTYVHKKLQTEYTKLIYDKMDYQDKIQKAMENWCTGIRFVAREDAAADEAAEVKALRYGKRKHLKPSKGSEVISGVEVDRELAGYCEHYKKEGYEAVFKGFAKIGHLGKAVDYKIVEDRCQKECGLPDPEEVAAKEKEKAKEREAAEAAENAAGTEVPSDAELGTWRTKQLRKFLEEEGVDPRDVGTDKTDLLRAAREAAERRRSGAVEETEPPPFDGKWTPFKQCPMCTFLHKKLQNDYQKMAYSKDKRPIKVDRAVSRWCRGLRGVVKATNSASGEVLGYSTDAERLRREFPEGEQTTGAEVDAEVGTFCREYRKRNEKAARDGFRKVEKASQFPIVDELCKQECKHLKQHSSGEAKSQSGADRKAERKARKARERGAKGAGEPPPDAPPGPPPSDEELSGMRVRQLREFLSSAGVDVKQVGTDKHDLLVEAKRVAAARREERSEQGGGENEL